VLDEVVESRRGRFEIAATRTDDDGAERVAGDVAPQDADPVRRGGADGEGVVGRHGAPGVVRAAGPHRRGGPYGRTSPYRSAGPPDGGRPVRRHPDG